MHHKAFGPAAIQASNGEAGLFGGGGDTTDGIVCCDHTPIKLDAMLEEKQRMDLSWERVYSQPQRGQGEPPSFFPKADKLWYSGKTPATLEEMIMESDRFAVTTESPIVHLQYIKVGLQSDFVVRKLMERSY
jgi:hypothetical protein